MMKKTESFPISEELVREFIKVNTPVWKSESGNGKYIYLNFSMVRMQAGWIVPKLLYAKGLAEKTGARVIVITWHDNSLLTDFIESFGMEHISLDRLCKSSPLSGLRAGLKTLFFLIKDGTGEGLIKMNALGFNVGRALYEDILRTSDLSTLKSCRNKTASKKIFHLLWTLFALDGLCKRKPVIYGVTDDMAYHEGMYIKLFIKHGAKDFASSNVGETPVLLGDDGEPLRFHRLLHKKIKNNIGNVNDEFVRKAEDFLAKRFAGENGREIDRGAFSGRVCTREELSDELGLDKNKKNVVVMCHTFSDAVFAYGLKMYRDYYDWMENTMSAAESITDVNWIIKPHPSRKLYNEEKDSIEDMYKRHKKSHIFMLSDDVSAASIKTFADVLVTVGGTAGCEFACIGIPSVIIGKPAYSEFGFTVEPKTRREYEDTLRNISKIEALNDEQIATAKKIFYMINNRDGDWQSESEIPYDDEFAVMINSRYKEMHANIAKEYFIQNKGTNVYNDNTLKDLIDYMKDHDVRESCFYRLGALRAERD